MAAFACKEAIEAGRIAEDGAGFGMEGATAESGAGVPGSDHDPGDV